MKKFLALALVMILAITAFVGCEKKKGTDDETTVEEVTTAEVVDTDAEPVDSSANVTEAAGDEVTTAVEAEVTTAA